MLKLKEEGFRGAHVRGHIRPLYYPEIMASAGINRSFRFTNLLRVIIQLRDISGKRILEARLIDLRGSRAVFSGSSCVIKLKRLGVLLEMDK